MSNDYGEVFPWDGSDAPRVLWLSRHAMSVAQAENLPDCAAGMEVVTQNVTYPAHSDDAVREIEALAAERNVRVVLAVLPAHIAAAFARRKGGFQKLRLFVPVAAPQAADEDGKPRPFAHSHWEEC